MKNRNLILVLFVVILLIMGGMILSHQSKNSQVNYFKEKNTYLENVNQRQDSLLNEVLTFLNEFEENMEVILESEGLMQEVASESQTNQSYQTRMSQGIHDITKLLSTNHAIIDSLHIRLQETNKETNQLQNLVTRMQVDLDERSKSFEEMKNVVARKEVQVVALHEKIGHLNKENTTLVTENEDLNSKVGQKSALLAAQLRYIKEQDEKLNQGFVIVGSEKELKEKNIITKEGGVVGIGSTPVLNKGLEKSRFEEIDIFVVREFTLGKNKPEIISMHPISSYEIIENYQGKNEDGLRIIEPENFWGSSRYLVVLTN